MEKKLKVYKLELSPNIDDNSGVTLISLVKAPAIQKNFVTFSEGENKKMSIKFSVTDEDQRIVTGPILLADFPIYRNERDDDGKITNEFYIVADKPTISSIIQKFFKTQRTNSASTEHDGCLLNGVYLMESFQVDASRGIQSPIGYGNISDGSWFGSMKIDNDEIWNEIKAGTFKGFSIEGLFDYKLTGEAPLKQATNLDIYKEFAKLV